MRIQRGSGLFISSRGLLTGVLSHISKCISGVIDSSMKALETCGVIRFCRDAFDRTVDAAVDEV
jgi:hypothetical protein